MASELRKLDWDLDVGPLNDLSLLWFDRLATTARVVKSQLIDKLSGKPVPPAPLTGYAALQLRCRGEQRAKRSRFAQHWLHTGEDLPGFLGGDGSVYYSKLRAAERDAQAEEEAADQRRQEAKRWREYWKQHPAQRLAVDELNAWRKAPRMKPLNSPSYSAMSTWVLPSRGEFPPPQPVPRPAFRQGPLPHPSLVFIGPSLGTPIEPVVSAVVPFAPAVPVYPWIPAPAAPGQGLGQDTALVYVPEQAVELPCEPQPATAYLPVAAPVYQGVQQQFAALSLNEPEFAVGVEQPQPVYCGPPASLGWAPEVEMLDVDDAAKWQTLPTQAAEPRSNQVLEVSTQVGNYKKEQAQEPLPAPKKAPASWESAPKQTGKPVQPQSSQGELLRNADGTPLLDRNGNPIVGRSMTINLNAGASRPLPSAARPSPVQAPPAPVQAPPVPPQSNPVLDEEDAFEELVARFIAKGETDEGARVMASKQMGW